MREYDDLLFDRVGTDGRVARITLNRPAHLNALSRRLITELGEALRTLEADDSVRVIVLRGAGRAFSSGWDIGDTDLQTSHPDSEGRYVSADADGRPLMVPFGLSLRLGAEVQLKLWDVARVTIVQAHGHCLGGGLELAMMADLVTASTDCQLGHPAHRGVGVARNGMILPRVVGMRRAKELYYTGDSLSGTEAAERGLINYAWPAAELDERTVALADRIANASVDYLAVLKQSINGFYEQMGLRQSVALATQLDAVAQTSRTVREWNERLARDGFRSAVAWRDGRYDAEGVS